MKLELLRYSTGKESTLGLLYLDDKFVCFTIEDQKNDKKVMHKTRIPEGEYEIKLRTVGGFHANYSKQFKDIHKGMLWLQDVPGFEYILIHVGNTDNDSSGCILVGNGATENVVGRGSVTDSVKAYRRIYPVIAAAILKGETVTIEVR
jgi:hypothetical protein